MFKSLSLKRKTKGPTESSIDESRPPSIKSVPIKLAKKVKRQFQRLLSHNHVHLSKLARSTDASTSTSSLSSTSSHIPTIDILPEFAPHSDETWLRHKLKEVDDRETIISSIPSTHRPSSSVSTAWTEEDNHEEAQPLAKSSTMDVLPESQELAHGRADEPLPAEPMFTSPPTVYIEPEAPDPFLIDDAGDALSDEENGAIPTPVSGSQLTMSPAHDIPLTLSASPPPPAALPHSSPLISSNINKDVPPPPSDSDLDEDEAPDLYLPGLIIPTMFLPIPNTDPLTTLLSKYIYPPEKRPVRDLTGDWQHSDFHTLVMTNSWRALARMARDRIVKSDPSDITLILGLWYLRLSSLARLRLFNQTSAECTNLFVVLNAIEPVESRAWVFERVLPFELEVMQTRLKYWAGDAMGYLDTLYALLRKCRLKARQAKLDTVVMAMWKERGARVCLIIASQMVEMKEYTAAAKLLEPLCKSEDGVSSNATLRSSTARIYLQSGNLRMAIKHFDVVAADPQADASLKEMNAAVLAAAQGDWAYAGETLKAIVEKDGENYVAVNNLSVALLSQGKLKEGIEVLETALKASPSSVVVAEPFLFNLSTLYELRSSTGVDKKRDLLIEVAKWSGDGLKTSCLKLPAN